MEYARLGHSGLSVSRLCLGTMMFGRWGNPDHDDCARILNRALDEGITLIDTANRYGMGESEEIVGKALATRRDEAVLATKVFMPGPGGRLDRGTSRRHIMMQVEESLRRLRTDWIDVYQIHRNDPGTPLEETLSAMTDLVRQGKVRYLGVSTGNLADSHGMHFGGWKMVESLWISERRHLERFVSTQPPYSIFTREAEREIFPVCRAHGFGAIVWSPIEGGWLSGRYRKGQPPPDDSRARNQTEFGAFVAPQFDMTTPKALHRLELVETLAGLADEAGLPLSRYALAWTLANPAVTSAIIGPRVMRHLDDSLAAAGRKLPEEHLARIDELVTPGSNV
ncbi:MAG TPA: aldo/keto reductase [Candidatus Binatia bacterium]|jgi:aryl-alcohol dehydrogenase-like predicted oxidoreductase|nr:aldo/keto reductase [Candidatus Binatia bacterium]